MALVKAGDTSHFVYWLHSLVDIRAAIRTIHPTPSERLGAPF